MVKGEDKWHSKAEFKGGKKVMIAKANIIQNLV
jgi:hypothetical protein